MTTRCARYAALALASGWLALGPAGEGPAVDADPRDQPRRASWAWRMRCTAARR